MNDCVLPVSRLDALASKYDITFSPETLLQIEGRAPILERIEILLEAVETGEVKLTPKGNLPTDLVQKIARHRPDLQTQLTMEITKRSYEDNYYAVQQVHILAETAQLIRVSGKKLLPGRMYRAYRAASAAEQYLYLLDRYERINLGYFDGYEDEPVTHEVKLLLVRLLRNNDPQWRTPQEYVKWLIQGYTRIEELIEENIEQNSLFEESPLEQFYRIFEVRVVARYLVPFGLVDEQERRGIDAVLLTRKTALLDALVRAQAPRDSSGILTRKVLSQFGARARKFKFDNPFHVLMYGLSVCVDMDQCDPEGLAGAIVSQSETPQVLQTELRRYLVELFGALRATLLYFLTPENGSAKEQEEDERHLRSFWGGLNAILPQENPHQMFQQLLSAMWAIDLTLRKHFDIVIDDPSADETIAQRLSEDARYYLEEFLAIMAEIEKVSRKAKRINKKLQERNGEAVEKVVLFYLTVLNDRTASESADEETEVEFVPRVYQLRVDLMDTKPPIWRRILVSETATLYDLHCAIQGAMGWMNGHLHGFEKGRTWYGPKVEDDFELMETQDENRYTVGELLTFPTDYLYYEYDFGDGWRHRVRLEKILDPMPDRQLPMCIKARGACPPEDIGGVWGYYDMLEKLNDPNDPERDEYLEWLGGEFDPDAFDIEEANAIMARGCSNLMGL